MTIESQRAQRTKEMYKKLNEEGEQKASVGKPSRKSNFHSAVAFVENKLAHSNGLQWNIPHQANRQSMEKKIIVENKSTYSDHFRIRMLLIINKTHRLTVSICIVIN